MILNLATSTSYYDVHVLTGFASGKSLVIHNETSSPIFVVVSPTLPTGDSQAVIMESGATYSFSAGTSKLWVRGSTGPIGCEVLTSAVSSQVERVDLSPDLYTSDAEGFRRLRVDSGQTGFFEGREFRTFYEMNIASGASVYIRFVSQLGMLESVKAGAFQVEAGDVPDKPAITALTPSTVANATDEAIALVNDLKVKVNAIIAALKS